MENANEEVIVNLDNDGEDGSGQGEEVVTLKKSEYEKLNQTLGSLKRENKDLKKPKDSITEAPKTSEKSEINRTDNSLLEKAFLRSAGITNSEEVELALNTAKKWGQSIDQVVDDEDFQTKLNRLRTQKSNEIATSNIKGTASQSQAKLSPEYWIAKGVPPTPNDIADRATRVKIHKAMMAKGTSTGQFYNE